MKKNQWIHLGSQKNTFFAKFMVFWVFLCQKKLKKATFLFAQKMIITYYEDFFIILDVN
jgi:hypothetical protein